MTLYLTNRARSLWFSKPGAEVNLNISLETVVLNALKLTESRKKEPALLDYPEKPAE